MKKVRKRIMNEKSVKTVWKTCEKRRKEWPKYVKSREESEKEQEMSREGQDAPSKKGCDLMASIPPCDSLPSRCFGSSTNSRWTRSYAGCKPAGKAVGGYEH